MKPTSEKSQISNMFNLLVLWQKLQKAEQSMMSRIEFELLEINELPFHAQAKYTDRQRALLSSRFRSSYEYLKR